MNLTGRKSEQKILFDALKSKRPELIVVYGRRRIGKTFLIRQTYKNNIKFEFSGMFKAPLKQQLKKFHLTLSDKKTNFPQAVDWLESFHQLEQYLNKLRTKKKKVVFIDEFPWLDTAKSNFLPAFDSFWNSYASKKNDLVVIICGSAASYMIKNIIKNKGGLHNRLTEKIRLNPFNLYETELFLKHKGVKLTRYDIIRLYMTTGGVPFYLEKIKPGESTAQTIDRLCFTENGFLRNEFDNVFASLFSNADNHSTIVRALSKVRKGLTRTEILTKSNVKSGGTLSKTLTELEESGFIDKYMPLYGKKDALYRLTDEYSMFYLKYIKNTKPSKSSIWTKLQGKPSYKIWSGFSFETICIKHTEQIKAALSISGIYSKEGSWIGKNSKNGAQIDFLIDRDDNVINLCEIKFYDTWFKMSKNYAQDIAKKINIFQTATKTNKSVFVTIITTFGMTQNKYSRQLIQNEINMEDLFVNI